MLRVVYSGIDQQDIDILRKYRSQNSVYRKAAKPLYMGDQDTVFTMCVKKTRRHAPSDGVAFVGTSVETGNEDTLVLCKHCREWLSKKAL